MNGLMRRSKRHLYSIALSARPSSEGGTARPSALAVLRLTVSSDFVGPAPTWVALRKPPTTGFQIGRVPRQRCSNDPRYGTPCTCADGGLCRGVDAGHVPWRKQQSVAD